MSHSGKQEEDRGWPWHDEPRENRAGERDQTMGGTVQKEKWPRTNWGGQVWTSTITRLKPLHSCILTPFKVSLDMANEINWTKLG